MTRDNTYRCTTGERRLIMWEIGVEGDKFRPHRYNDACISAGCVPLTRTEFIRYRELSPAVVDNVAEALTYENMLKAVKL